MLAPVLALAAALVAPGADSPLAACRASPIEGTGWVYDCGGGRRAQHSDSGRMPAAARDELLRGSFGMDEAEETRETRTVAGNEMQIIRHVSPRETFLAAVIEREEGTRLLACHEAAKGSWCDAVLALLAARPWRGGPVEGTTREPPRAVTLRGAPVSFPAWCQGKLLGERGARVDCRGPGDEWPRFAMWFEGLDVARGRALMEKFEALAGQQLEQLVQTGARFSPVEKIPCRMAGQVTTCLRRRNAAVGLLWGTTGEGQDVRVGVCLGNAPVTATPPCSLLFAAP